MYLHIGQNEILPDRRVIGIFDLDKCSYGKRTREYLAAAEKEGVVLDVSGEIPKSFVVCDHPYHRQIVYLSQLNSTTLQKRAESGNFSSSFTSLETGALVLFLAAVFTVQLILLQNYSWRRRWLPLILCAAALLALELGILAVKYLFLSVFSGDGWSSPLLLVYSVFLLLLYFAWVALFAALLALLIYPILKKLRI